MEATLVVDLAIGHLHLDAALQFVEALIEHAPLSRRQPAATEILLEPFQATKPITQTSSLDGRQRAGANPMMDLHFEPGLALIDWLPGSGVGGPRKRNQRGYTRGQSNDQFLHLQTPYTHTHRIGRGGDLELIGRETLSGELEIGRNLYQAGPIGGNSQGQS
jgi:hypothetical protein